MSQEIKEAIEDLGIAKCYASPKAEEYINHALTKLRKEQPPTGDFTEKIRSFIKLYENEIPRRAEITFLKEACAIIDRAETSKADLLTACKIGLKKALGISVVAAELGAQILPKHQKDIEQIEAAIAKEKER